MLGGTLADKYGGKQVMAAGVVLWSLFTFLTPDSAALGTVFLISCRIAMGLGEVPPSTCEQICCLSVMLCYELDFSRQWLAVQGVAFPAVHSVISATVPRARQSTAVAIVTAASYTGAATHALSYFALFPAWGGALQCTACMPVGSYAVAHIVHRLCR